MARFVSAEVQTSGVYAFLARQEEAELQTWEANVSRTHHHGAPYPRQRILDDLRAGRTVNVPTCSLPKWAPRGLVRMVGTVKVLPARAIVRPDDTVTFTDVDATRLWLEENDL